MKAWTERATCEH